MKHVSMDKNKNIIQYNFYKMLYDMISNLHNILFLIKI